MHILIILLLRLGVEEFRIGLPHEVLQAQSDLIRLSITIFYFFCRRVMMFGILTSRREDIVVYTSDWLFGHIAII